MTSKRYGGDDEVFSGSNRGLNTSLKQTYTTCFMMAPMVVHKVELTPSSRMTFTLLKVLDHGYVKRMIRGLRDYGCSHNGCFELGFLKMVEMARGGSEGFCLEGN
ncbi:hypothetical protein LR48_Vigan01g126300 [Vigna angularis]|uniref:Uncharacterized protein n=1 Tax=Phaseolus angularis TaxID=3914 RepID=A0A0L9TM85_PHAAN|nr:hypothetical protein LR48_Vigan01g126300 [Vigna angularis]